MKTRKGKDRFGGKCAVLTEKGTWFCNGQPLSDADARNNGAALWRYPREGPPGGLGADRARGLRGLRTRACGAKRLSGILWATLFLAVFIGVLSPARGSIAFGSINNFDVVNDTGAICHGFEIEIDGIRSKDITYTYDWNHYGVPTITEDISNPMLPRVFVRYQSAKNPDGSWASFTAIPAAPIGPTDGHQFTNPSVNFGGEHFGVGFYGTPVSVQYHWLIDNGAGGLGFGGAVNIATPAFSYFPPVNAAPAQVQAVIVPPPPPELPALEFGEAIWVKVTKTSTHSSKKVELKDLVSDDPNDPNDKNWTNGEPDEVEVEWQILQTDFKAGNGGKNGELASAADALKNGDEVVTLRYDFFKYIGPLDPETGEALAENVGPDGLHGVGTAQIGGLEVDLATVVVVGDYIGAQMAGFDAAAQIGLIDHLQDGVLNTPYVERTLVVGGTPPIISVRTGALPNGLTFDPVTGVLSGIPAQSGSFPFTLHSTDASAKGGDVTNSYVLTILEDGQLPPPPHLTVTTVAVPAQGGVTKGGGEYALGALVTVVAVETPGNAFLNWTEGGTIVATTESYSFTGNVNRKLEANFLPTYEISPSAAPDEGGVVSGAGLYRSGDLVTLMAAPNAGFRFLNWTEGGVEVRSSQAYTLKVEGPRSPVAHFEKITCQIVTSSLPAQGGATSGGGAFFWGEKVTVLATPNPGYLFQSWTEAGRVVSLNPEYAFVAENSRTLVAKFTPQKPPLAIGALHLVSPVIGGMRSLGVVTIDGKAPLGGVSVVLENSAPLVLRVPRTVVIPKDKKSATFRIDTTKVSKVTEVIVRAKLNGSERAGTVKVVGHKFHGNHGH